MNKLPNVTISGFCLSDAFFNSKLEAYGLASEFGGEEQPIEEALLDDAKDFINLLGINEQIEPAELVKDFLKRV